MIVHQDSTPEVSQDLQAYICWMDTATIQEGKKLIQVVITNVVLVKGRLVYIKYHHPYFDKNSVSKAKQENNRMVWRFFEANTTPEEVKK